MATLTVTQSNYDRITSKASELELSIDSLLESLMPTVGVYEAKTDSEKELWLQRFNEMILQIKARTDRYPPGFEADCDRDTIYGEREDAQL